MRESYSVILLAYNEENNLKVLFPKLKKCLENMNIDFEIVVVDTHVPMDNTLDLCMEYGVKYYNQPGKGFGDAYRTGISKASKRRILTLDSDGAHPVDAIPNMIKKFETNKYDVVIGSRYVKGGKTQDPWTNVLMSKILNNVYAFVFNLKAKDLSTNFRIYNAIDIKGITLDCENYDVLQEILIKLDRIKKIKFGEVPIELQKRVFGSSKRQFFKFVLSYIKTIFKLVGKKRY